MLKFSCPLLIIVKSLKTSNFMNIFLWSLPFINHSCIENWNCVSKHKKNIKWFGIWHTRLLFIYKLLKYAFIQQNKCLLGDGRFSINIFAWRQVQCFVMKQLQIRIQIGPFSYLTLLKEGRWMETCDFLHRFRIKILDVEMIH